jgi:hypothetical protein
MQVDAESLQIFLVLARRVAVLSGDEPVSANAIRNLADPVVLTTLVRLANQPVAAATESGQVVTAST